MAQLGVNHKLSSAYHPQTDGQTERLNQTLEQYLRSYTNEQQDDWVKLLPIAQFAYNSAKSEATQVSPFFANYGFEPKAYRQPRKDDTMAEQAIVTVDKLQHLHQQLAADIEFANIRMKMYANRKRRVGPPLERGDKVYLLRRHIKTKRPSSKLDFKKLGPFKILEKIGEVNYRLQLPGKSRLHPVFHVSLLEPAKGDTPIITDIDIQPENDEVEYEVEKIVDTRTTTSGQQEYLVKWEGYPESENTWEPTENLNHCSEKLQTFHQLRRQAQRKVRALPETKTKEENSGRPRRSRADY